MKKFMGKIRDLSQKAAEFQAAIERVPPKIAHVRETVAMTSGQLRQLRADVQAGIGDLRADNEAGLLQALQELNHGAPVFQEAGYEMAGIDMELNPNQRWIVHLWKAAEPDMATLESLVRRNQSSRTVHGVLTSILKAEEMARQVALDGFTYQKLVVHVGLIPSVRMCWIADDVEAETPAVAVVSPVAATASAQAKPVFEQSSYFARRPAETAGTSSVATPTESSPKQSEAVTAPGTPLEAVTGMAGSSVQAGHGSDWKADALERFKKMPDLSKYRK
jgi:hypothetical protein